MGSNKRARQAVAADQEDDDIPALKKRAVYSEQEKNVAKAYNDLADEVPSIRLAAATTLIKSLAEADDKPTAYQKAITRLSKGVCSGRKAARLGLSIALTEVFRYVIDHGLVETTALIKLILDATTHLVKASGEEKRNYLLGRRFAFQALLESGLAISSNCSGEDWKVLIDIIANHATDQPYLRKEYSAIIYDVISGSQQTKLSAARLQQIIDTWTEKSLWKNPEGIALWLTLPHADGVKLPKHIWHHRDPLSDKERLILAKVMQDVASDEMTSGKKGDKSGARQFSPSFAWKVVLAELWSLPSQSAFNNFYKDAIDQGFFSRSSSAERKSFGLQVINAIVREAPITVLSSIFSTNVAHCIVDHSSHADRSLSAACRFTIDQMIERASRDHEAAAVLAIAMLNTATNFDQLTKTKAVMSIFSKTDSAGKLEAIKVLKEKLAVHNGKTGKDIENQLRLIGDTILSVFRAQTELGSFFEKTKTNLQSWAKLVLETLSSIALQSKTSQQAPAAVKSMYWNRLMSCLGWLLKFPVECSVVASTMLVSSSGSSDDPRSAALLQRAKSCIKRSQTSASKNGKEVGSDQYALQLMISMSALQVYGDEPDAVPLLEDLLNAVEANDSSDESTTMLVEIVLSFVSKTSLTYKKLAEQTFTALAPNLTEDSLQSMLDILEQKEGKSGQQALFADSADTEVTVRAGESDEDEDEDMLDVEEDSDVEIVNGVVAEPDDDASESEDQEGEDSDSSEEDDSDSESEIGGNNDDDEDAAFDRKLAEALGTSGFEDSGDDDSDMDDEQMMALEPHLAKIFQERSKVASSKQDNKDARENIVMFKSRVLDLLSIYVKSQYSNPIALALIQPLLALSRTSSNKQITEKATAVLKQLYDSSNKDKSQTLQSAGVLMNVLAEVHEEIQQGGSKLHGNACSRSSLFLAKTLLAIDASYFDKVSEMYNKLQKKWYLDPKSKIQGSFFTDWTSWLLTTKKQK